MVWVASFLSTSSSEIAKQVQKLGNQAAARACCVWGADSSIVHHTSLAPQMHPIGVKGSALTRVSPPPPYYFGGLYGVLIVCLPLVPAFDAMVREGPL